MPLFSYKGRDGGGNAVEGVLEGVTAAMVANTLFGRGITPLHIVESDKQQKNTSIDFFKPKIEHIDVLLFTRQIHTLLKAGVPIMRAFLGMQESNPNPSMKELIGEIRESLDGGRELSAALARRPKVFSPFYLAMVRVGEVTGMLEEVFLRLFKHLDFQQFMRNQVKSALRYPMFVIAAMVVAISVVNIFVIPAFAKVFEGFGAQLPFMTRVLLASSGFFVNYWWLMLVMIIGAVFFFRSWVATSKGRYEWDRFKLRVPIAGKIVEKGALARFSASFALAMRSGVPIVQAMSVVATTVDNDYIASKIDGMRDTIERGESVLRAAINAKVFTPVVLQMLAVGEESGSLDEMMEEVAGMYEREVEYDLKNLSSQIEPILIVFLGVLVLILALGIFLPIWDLGRVAMGKH
jgi:MSHA biogenesis protein MshG